MKRVNNTKTTLPIIYKELIAAKRLHMCPFVYIIYIETPINRSDVIYVYINTHIYVR